MAINVRTTSLADGKIQALSPTDFVAFDQTMGIASGVTLPGQQNGLQPNKPERIAVLNHTYDVYLLDPGSLCPYALCAYDGGPYMIVSDLKDRSTVPHNPDTHAKRSLAGECASGMGVIPHDIFPL
jgi:hypothetical protein